MHACGICNSLNSNAKVLHLFPLFLLDTHSKNLVKMPEYHSEISFDINLYIIMKIKVTT